MTCGRGNINGERVGGFCAVLILNEREQKIAYRHPLNEINSAEGVSLLHIMWARKKAES